MNASPSREGIQVHLETRTVLRVGGSEARDFLQGLVSNDVRKVSGESAIYAALLTPQGKFLFDMMIAQAPDDGALLLDVEAARAGDLLKRLKLYKMRADVTLEDLTDAWQVIAALGDPGRSAHELPETPGAARARWAGTAFTDPRHAGLGARLLVPSSEAPQTGGTVGDYHAQRIALGVPEGGLDIQPDKSFLLESNFEEIHGVDFRKGCYVGQETTARTKHRGTARKRILIVEADTAPEPGAALEAGSRGIGTVLSIDASSGRALALVRLEPLRDAEAEGTDITLGGRPARVVRPDWLTI